MLFSSVAGCDYRGLVDYWQQLQREPQPALAALTSHFVPPPLLQPPTHAGCGREPPQVPHLLGRGG
jgi:hypothetical protein